MKRKKSEKRKLNLEPWALEVKEIPCEIIYKLKGNYQLVTKLLVYFCFAYQTTKTFNFVLWWSPSIKLLIEIMTWPFLIHIIAHLFINAYTIYQFSPNSK